MGEKAQQGFFFWGTTSPRPRAGLDGHPPKSTGVCGSKAEEGVALPEWYKASFKSGPVM